MPSEISKRRPNRLQLGIAHLSRTIAAVELRKFLVGTIFWSVGHQMVTVTQTYIIFDITQSELQLAILGAAVTSSSIAMSVVGGILADRVGRKSLLLSGSVMTTVSMLTIGVLMVTGNIQPWHIQVAGAVGGAALAIDWTARFSLLPTMVDRNILPRAVSFDLSIFNLGRLVTPLAWGWIVSKWGYEWTYFVIATLMTINFAIVATYRPIIATTSSKGHAIWSEVTEITGVVRRNPILGGNLVYTVMNAFVMGGFIYLLTPISAQVFGVGPVEFSRLFAMIALGAFIAGLGLGFSGGVKRAGLALIATNFMAAGFTVAFAFSPTLNLGYAFAFLFGFVNAVHVGLGNIALQMSITENVRGRLAGVYELAWAGFPAGGFFFPAIAGFLGPTSALAFGGLFLVFINSSVAVLNPTLRRLKMRV